MNGMVQILIAVLNSLWQAAFIAALVWLALRFLPRIDVNVNAATRYVIWWSALAVVLVLPAAPGLMQLLRSHPTAAASLVTPHRVPVPAIPETPVFVTLRDEHSARWPLWILALWATVLLYRIIEIVRSYFYLRSVKRRATISLRTLPAIARPAKLLLSNDISSPMAVGFLHPAVILPKELSGQIEKAELDCILLHECAHLARYDDWANLAARLLGAALALHPVTVWILRRIEREREMACDDWVVARTGAARAYAASLGRMLNLRSSHRRGLANLKLASGIFGRGSRVGDRIEMLLKRGRDFSSRASLVRVAASTVVLFTLGIAGSLAPRWIAFAQQTVRPSFALVSIKPSNSVDRRPLIRTEPAGQLTVANFTVKSLIRVAYGIKDFQISGGPAWIGTDFFDIAAGAGEPVNNDQYMLMLQSLLAERFQLVIRRDTRKMPAYALVVARDGPKLKEANESALPVMRIRRGLLAAPASNMPALAFNLSNILGRAVADKTGLTGKYDLKLEWQPDNNQVAHFQAIGVPDGFGAPPADPRGPSLFTALEGQLGLRLKSQRGPVEMFTIERIEKPSGN